MADRVVMGGLAFVLLLLAEFAVGALLFGRTPGEHFGLYRDAVTDWDWRRSSGSA